MLKENPKLNKLWKKIEKTNSWCPFHCSDFDKDTRDFLDELQRIIKNETRN